MGPEDVEIEGLMDNGSDDLTPEQAYSLRQSLWELFRVLLAAVVLAGVFLVFFRASLVRGSSMEPTLHNGDCILVRTWGYDAPEPGDIVAIKAKDREGKHLVKRVIAGPGDWVDIDEHGNVFVNEVELYEPYLVEKALGDCDITLPYQVPESKIFVMGDHRSVSLDSRNTALGCVGDEQVVGKLLFRVWPFEGFGIV